MAKAPRKLFSDIALERARAACFAFPGVAEKLSHGAPCFFVRGKMFAMFAEDHHGDARTALWLKSDAGRREALMAEAPERFFVPPYVGVKGWVGVKLDPAFDWDELAVLVEESWLSAAPKSAHAEPVLPPPPSAPRPRTDPAVSRAALARIRAITDGLAGSEVESYTGGCTFRVRKKPYLYFQDNHHGDGIVGAVVKTPVDQVMALVARHPERYYLPAYIGKRGWLGVRVDRPDVGWQDVQARIVRAHADIAPKPRVTVRGRG